MEAHTCVDAGAASPMAWVCRGLSLGTLCCGCSALTARGPRVLQGSPAVLTPRFAGPAHVCRSCIDLYTRGMYLTCRFLFCTLSAGPGSFLLCSPRRCCEVGRGAQQRCTTCLLGLWWHNFERSFFQMRTSGGCWLGREGSSGAEAEG